MFGFMEQAMLSLTIQGVDIVRAKVNIALTNLFYMCRLMQIYRYNLELILYDM